MSGLTANQIRRPALMVILLVAVVLAGCSGGASEEQAIENQEPSGSTSTLTQAQEALVQQAATVANAIAKTPEDMAKILADHGMTADEYEALVYRISADPALARAYQEARQH